MVYRCLSPVAHPNIVNYTNRYFKANNSVESIEYNPNPELDEQASTQRLVLLLNILIGSTAQVCQILPNCNISTIEALLEKYVRKIQIVTPKPFK